VFPIVVKLPETVSLPLTVALPVTVNVGIVTVHVKVGILTEAESVIP
jgi:hypothetical protein